MARLANTAPAARDHIAAIAQLRWRLFLNTFRRKQSTTRIVISIIVRVILYSIAAASSIAPILVCGFSGYTLIAHSRPLLLPSLLWTLSTIWFFMSFFSSLAASQQPSLQSGGFDLSQLIGFPIGFPLYLAARLFFSLSSFTAILGMLCLLAMAIGIGIARPDLFFWAAIVLLLYGLTIFSFLRMILLWLDRWLAQRRTRETFLAFLTIFSVGMQFFSFSSRFPNRNIHRISSLHLRSFAHIAVSLGPVVAVLPPNLAAGAVLHMHSGHPLLAIAGLLGLAACFVSFIALYALRLRGEFRGENFSEASARGSQPPVRRSSLGWNLSGLSPTITACIEKEVRYLFRGGSALVGLVTPLLFVAIFIHRLSRSPGIALPSALAYVMFGLVGALYNIFGADGPGVSLYLLAPVRPRSIFLAKNLVSATIIAAEVFLATLIVSFSTRVSAAVLTATLLWVIFVVFANLAFGNLRSLHAPHLVVVDRNVRPTASRGGALMTLVFLFGSLLLCIAVIWACEYFHHPWLPTLIFLALAAAAFAVYFVLLDRIDGIVLAQRDVLIDELCRT